VAAAGSIADPGIFPKVIVASHMAYFTDHVRGDIAQTALQAFGGFERRSTDEHHDPERSRFCLSPKAHGQRPSLCPRLPRLCL